MPQVEVTASVGVKDNQKDTDYAASVDVAFKDTKGGDYNGPIRVKLAPGGTRAIDVSHIQNARILALKMWSGVSVRLQLRKSASENTDLRIGRVFVAEVLNLEQVKLINDGAAEVDLQIAFFGIDE